MATTAARAQPFATAVYPETELSSPQASLAASRVKAAGASFIRITAYWAQIAPLTRPSSFDPTDPSDPAYDWSALDAQVKTAAAAGLVPYVTVVRAPTWAQAGSPRNVGSSFRPSVSQFGDFMTAIAKRYDGHFEGLPRVRYWEIWNEPNLSIYLEPQFDGKQPVSPSIYRALVNAGATAVKGVAAHNFVIAGALSPFHDQDPLVLKADKQWGPLSFMRAVLCLNASLKPTCHMKTEFDAWSFHPYTSGGPLHTGQTPNDLSLGDMPKLRPILAAARRYGHLTAPRAPQLWVTEFSWDSYQPDLKGVPMATLLHWVPEAFFRMWQNGVSVVTWFGLRDFPTWQSYYQSGLYYWGGKTMTHDPPKPILAAFRFPFVALPHGSDVSVWGRAPKAARGPIVVEQKVGSRWVRLQTVRTDSNGLFTKLLPAKGGGDLRARSLTNGLASPGFAPRELPDHWYNPFGSTTLS
jgi:hypothetical protein